jgi:hypothetical protein
VTERAREQGRGTGEMSGRTAAWLAWSMWALCLPFATFNGGALGFLSASARIYPDSVMIVLLASLALTFATVGAFVASRRPENPIGWIFCIGGLVLSVVVSATNYTQYALSAGPGRLPGVGYAAWVATWATIPTWFLIATMLFLLFPDGKLPSREWGFVACTAVIASVMAALGDAFGRERAGTDFGSIANPVAVGGNVGNALDMLGEFGNAFLFLSFFASVAAPLVRLSRARGQERQQIKWFAYATALMVGGFFVAFLLGSGYSQPSELMWDLGWLMGIVGFAFLPIATAIAILKYRLYDIDRIINRTLVYGSLTVLLGVVYFGGVTATQTIFQTIPGQEKLPQLAIVASTLVIAALFSPLRRRIQSFIDRRFYRRKYDARKTLEVFSATLRDETDLDALSDDLTSVVKETMQPAHVSLWLRPDTSRKSAQAH